MLFSINLLFYFLLSFSTMMVFSSPSWFCMWIGIEMNTMAFIPLLYQFNNKLSTESALKYFLVQTFASMIMFLAIIMMIKDFYLEWSMSNMMMLSMGIKLGAAPFHMWYPSVVEGLAWSQNMVLMTWQKIAPLMVMSSLQSSIFNIIMMISSSIMGPIGAFNQASLRKIMAYSSITHLSWMIITMFNKSITWMIYMLIYFTTTIIMVFMLMMMKINYIMQIITSPPNYMFLLMINLLSMGGFPPMLGFASKWLVLTELIHSEMTLISMILVVSSCMNLYIYLRIIHPLIHMKSIKPKLQFIAFPPHMMLSSLSLFSMLTVPIILLM